jgi:hypothetical protein
MFEDWNGANYKPLKEQCSSTITSLLAKFITFACFLKLDTQHKMLKEKMVGHLGSNNPSIDMMNLSHSLWFFIFIPQRPQNPQIIPLDHKILLP